jgi:hypothetical protein
MRITGRFGQVAMGASPETILGSINGWDLSEGRNYVDVTSFLDTNKVSVPDLPDVSGNIKGFYNVDPGSPAAGDSIPWLEAAEAPTPTLLKLSPDIQNTPMRFWEGLAYLDMKIDVQVAGAVTLASAFKAAASWTRH